MRSKRAWSAAAAVALHAALLLALLSSRPPQRAGPEPARVTVRLIALPPVIEPARTPPRAEGVGPTAPPPRSTPRAATPMPVGPTTAVDAPAASPTSTVDSRASTEAPPGVEPAASSPPSLLDSEATRRAVSQAAKEHGAGARTVAASDGAPATPQERLGKGIADGALGDCLKGDYPGAGMGLLSVPFLAAAVLGEKCRR